MDESKDITRSDLADRLLGHREVLVSRIRRYLAGVGASTQQADDIFSTTVRRTDMLAAAGKIVDRLADDDLIALSSAIARNAAREAGRETRRDRRRESAAAERMQETRSREADARLARTDPLAEEFLARIGAEDLEVIGLKLRGADWPAIAAELGTSVAAAQRRYYRALKAVAALSE